MSYKKLLTIQDISCVGQCSLTVALPIISACGVETAVLPSAVLSTHTGGFKGFTFRDLTEDMPSICAHWKAENIRFNGVYTGYLGSAKQIEYVKNIIDTLLIPGGLSIIDPAMADNGRLYVGFDMPFVEEMKALCSKADIVLPNITEAALLTGHEYRELYDESYINSLISAMKALGPKTVVLTGVGYEPGTTGVVISTPEYTRYYKHGKISSGCHGTGDIYASAFTGALMNGRECYDAAVIAADFTVKCIENTISDKTHWYGAKFETALPQLIKALEK